MISSKQLAVAAIALAAIPVGRPAADEGMWTFENPPLAQLAKSHGFVPDAGWLDALRAASLNVGGGSGAFVSPEGLVLTNHHVVRSCIQRLSTPQSDLSRDGFAAATRVGERACPGLEVTRLESVEDVTEQVRRAVRATDNERANEERNAAVASIEKACHDATGLRCEVETLYRGAVYRLHRATVWSDVRLVFVPETSVAFFGGDPDNFTFPRFDLDCAFLRVYDKGVPVRAKQYLRIGSGVREGDLVFVAGHPYETDRLKTVAQLELDRDVRLPLMLASAKRQRADLLAFSARSPESRRRAEDRLFGTENWLKSMIGSYKTLREPELLARKAKEEATLRSAATATPSADPWARIASASAAEARAMKENWSVSYGWRTLFHTAGTIVELANERALSDHDRLPDYRDSALPTLIHRLTSEEPIYKDLEIDRQATFWQEAVDLLGRDHPFVVRVLRGKSPREAATAVIEGSHIDEVQVRRKLVEGGAAAVNASDDPLIVLARAVYPMRRQVAKRQEVEVDEPIRVASDEIARLRFRNARPETYPDATGTLRLSYGVVRGYDADGILVPWRTNFWGLFARSFAFDARPPFDLPARWHERRSALDLATPLDFVLTADIIGGNSGSPVVDRTGEIVGVIFDGNLESLGTEFAYTEEKARAVAVDMRAIVAALRHVYGASGLLTELGQR